MGKATLVVMVAGIGSCFGGGIKQLEPVGPNGEIIMDYSIYDAMDAGFDKVVFVIRKDLEKDFKEVIGNRIKKIVEVKYAFQEKTDIPEPYKTNYADRVKPWGTGQAILCCKDVVNEPFLVINADDYYGKDAYVNAYNFLLNNQHSDELGMMGFVLENTLSENGGVTRGLCVVNNDNTLDEIVETKNIIKKDGRAVVDMGFGSYIDVDLKTPVSMNMWCLRPDFFTILETGFQSFLEECDDYLKDEYLLLSIIGELLLKKNKQVFES